MTKQWKRLAALSSAAVMAVGTLLYFPTDTLQNISWGITASAEDAGAGTESGTQTWTEDNLIWTLDAEGTMTVSGMRAKISIHAPTRGATTPGKPTPITHAHFNPRSHERSDASHGVGSG